MHICQWLSISCSPCYHGFSVHRYTLSPSCCPVFCRTCHTSQYDSWWCLSSFTLVFGQDRKYPCYSRATCCLPSGMISPYELPPTWREQRRWLVSIHSVFVALFQKNSVQFEDLQKKYVNKLEWSEQSLYVNSLQKYNLAENHSPYW